MFEKEAEEYVKKLLEGTEFEDDDMDVCAYTKREMLEAILHFAEPREKRIEELEKENAELKETIKHFNPCGEWNDDVHDCEFIHYAMEYGSKLTKAKEIINAFLDFEASAMERGCYIADDTRRRAEDFIKE